MARTTISTLKLALALVVAFQVPIPACSRDRRLPPFTLLISIYFSAGHRHGGLSPGYGDPIPGTPGTL